MRNNKEYAQYVRRCFDDAVRYLQEQTNTPEKLLKRTLKLEGKIFQATSNIPPPIVTPYGMIIRG